MTINELDLIFFLFLLTLLTAAYLITAFFQIKKYIKINKGSETKDYLPLSYGIAFLFMGIGRVILATFDVITEFNSANFNESNFWIWKLGSSVQLFGVGVWFLLMEKRVLKGKDKLGLLFFYIAFIAIGMILSDIIIVTTFVIIGMVFAMYIPIAYVYIAAKSDGAVRKKALFMLFGFIFVIFGALLTSELIIVPLTEATGLLAIHVHHIAFLIIILGVIFFFLGTKN